jgi:hypothetical protein
MRRATNRPLRPKEVPASRQQQSSLRPDSHFQNAFSPLAEYFVRLDNLGQRERVWKKRFDIQTIRVANASVHFSKNPRFGRLATS